MFNALTTVEEGTTLGVILEGTRVALLEFILVDQKLVRTFELQKNTPTRADDDLR